MTAQLRSEPNMISALDFLCENPSLTAAARHVGAKDSSKVLFRWIEGAADDKARGIEPYNSDFACRWPADDFGDGPWIFFCDAVLKARQRFAVLADGEARALVGPNAGLKSYIIEGGKVQPSPDFAVWHDSLTLSDDEWTKKYADRPRSDIWARRVNEKGETEIVPLERVEPVNAQKLIHVLRSILPGIYNPVNQTQSDVKLSGKVLVLGKRQPPNPNADTPMRRDLTERWAAIRADPNRASARPSAAVDLGNGGRSAGDPPENISGTMSDDVQPDLRSHPRAYEAPQPTPKPQAPVSYARPRWTNRLDGEDRPGVSPMPAGGVSMTTGRHT